MASGKKVSLHTRYYGRPLFPYNVCGYLPLHTHLLPETTFEVNQFFVLPIFGLWFYVTFENEVTKIQKYYVIFVVYILQGKMGKTEKS